MVSAASYSARISGEVSHRARPMPTTCEPWPGKIQATSAPGSGPSTTLATPFDDGCPARQTRAECDEQQIISRFHAPIFYSFTEGDRNRCGRGVAILGDVHVDLVC